MKSLVLTMAVVMALSAVVIAEDAPDLSVLPAKFRGVVLYPDGSTPVDRMAVRVWNADSEEVVFKTRTDKSGVFEIPELSEG